MAKQILAWHFLPNDRYLQFKHGVKQRVEITEGKLLRCDPEKLALCGYGLHASEKILDALQYASGNIVCRVRVGGKIIYGGDKLVASSRRVLWMIDAGRTLREFARWCALKVIDLWNAPEVVKKYLQTGDEKIMAAAGEVARAVAAREVAAGAAATGAAWAAAAGAAATGAARAVAAGGVAAWAAAWAAAAGEAAAGAARGAWATAAGGAWEAAQNEKLTEMILQEGDKQWDSLSGQRNERTSIC